MLTRLSTIFAEGWSRPLGGGGTAKGGGGAAAGAEGITMEGTFTGGAGTPPIAEALSSCVAQLASEGPPGGRGAVLPLAGGRAWPLCRGASASAMGHVDEGIVRGVAVVVAEWAAVAAAAAPAASMAEGQRRSARRRRRARRQRGWQRQRHRRRQRARQRQRRQRRRRWQRRGGPACVVMGVSPPSH